MLGRLQVLCLRKQEEKNIDEMVELTGLGQANVSKYLKLLTRRDCGVAAPGGAFSER